MKARIPLLRAFTLIEVILVIAAVGVLSSAGYITVTSVRETARETKLETDVANLNSAIQLYLANGGDLSSASTADDVLAKLKTRGDANVASFQVGLKGSFIDPRIEPVSQSGGESGSSQLRAVWNNSTKRFATATTGTGIKEFTLNEALAADTPVTEARARTLVAANVQSESPVWVWDYTDATPVTYNEGGVPVTVSGTGPGSPTGATLAQLQAPTFNPSGGNFSLQTLAGISGVLYNGTFGVQIDNPNGNVPSHIDIGNSITITPSSSGVTRSAKVISDDPDVWRDSEATVATYSVQPETLTATISFSDSSPTPYDIGVTPASGTAGTVTATATINEWNSIPDIFRDEGSSRNFGLAITTGATDPTTLGGVAQESLDLQITTASPWVFNTDSATLTVRAAVNVTNTALFTSSSPATETLTVAKLPLNVAFTPASGSTLTLSDLITIGPTGDFPADYTIRYEFGGATPTSSTGAVYGGGIGVPAVGAVTIKAAAYPASAYENWFTSPVATATYIVLPTGADGSIGGLLVSQVSNLNGEIIGSIQFLQAGAIKNTGAVDIEGNIFLPGTPNITGGTATVVTGTGSPTPVYDFDISRAEITGVIFTRIDPDLDSLSDTDAAYVEAILSGDESGLPNIPTSNVNVTVGANRTTNLAGGNYGAVTVRGNLVLGTPGATTFYNFDTISVPGNGQITLNGPVVIALRNGGTIRNVIGATEANSGYLTIYSQGNLTVSGGGGIYAKKIVTSEDIDIQGTVTLTQGVIADDAEITGTLTVGTFVGG